MTFSSPIPFREAINSLRSKALLPASASSAQLAELPAQIRARALFSARTINAGYLQTIQDLTDQLLSPGASRSPLDAPRASFDPATMRLKLKEALRSISYDPYAEPGIAGTIKDLSSDPRLNLIIQMQTEMAEGFGKYLQSQDPLALGAFPAQELFRAEDRKEPRDWPQRWMLAGGRFYGGGRMIALKSDPIWTAISSFDLPYPPFDYGSGMWVRDISRSESESFGLIEPGETPQPLTDPASGVWPLASASFKGLSSDLQAAVLASLPGAEFIDGVLHLKNSASEISDLVIANANFNAGQPRDSLGRWVDASGGGLSERHNIARGMKAARRALRRKADVSKAMYRDKLGQIDFVWGTPGEKAKNYAGGHGLSHILAKHGKADVKRLPLVLAKGRIMRHPMDVSKRLVVHENYAASLVKEKSRSSWVLTGFTENRR
jgi:hypothetical protein